MITAHKYFFSLLIVSAPQITLGMTRDKFYDPIQKRDYRKVMQLILDGENVNKGDECGNTPLHYAALNGFIAMTKLLLDCGASPNITNSFSETPLNFAAYKCRFKTMKLLLKQGAHPNLANREGKTTAFFTIKMGALKCTQLLFKHGISFMQPVAGIRELDDAMRQRHPDFKSFFPLHFAAYQHRKNILKYLLKDTNCDSQIINFSLILALHGPSFSSSGDECIKLLLDYGASVFQQFRYDIYARLILDWPITRFMLIWAHARAQGAMEEKEFIARNPEAKELMDINKEALKKEPNYKNREEQLEQETHKARLRMLCIKHGADSISDLLFQREIGMIRLP